MLQLASLAGIAAQVGYKRRPDRYGGKPAVVVENRLQPCFDASQSDPIWVTDITYIKTHEGWLYLCVVIDLFSRRGCRLVRPDSHDDRPRPASPADGGVAAQTSR